MNDAQKELFYIEQIELALEKALPDSDYGGPGATVTEAMQYSLMCGGKRIRPVLTLAFCELCGSSPMVSMPFACAVEMIHTYSLIHDDLPCMDNDDMRRGSPSNHKVYGESIALLAGDGLLTKAFEVMLSYKGEPAGTVAAAKVLAECAGHKGMVGGQCIDLEANGRDVDIDTLRAMDEGKTVALISAACIMGCIAAGASEKEIAAAERYAHGIGMAFQLRDDILDVVGDAGMLGKTTGIDTANNKSNYVSLLGVERSQELVEEYTREAVSALNEFSGDISFLKDLAFTLANREK